MTWTKYNNPSKKKHRRKMSRTDADIMSGKQMIIDHQNGIEMPIEHYDKLSDQLCGRPSRVIYQNNF